MELITLKSVRIARGKTQEDLAFLLGINIQTYRKIEANPDLATVKQVKLICDYLDAPYESIFFYNLTLHNVE